MGTRTYSEMKIIKWKTWMDMEAMTWKLKLGPYAVVTGDVRCRHPVRKIQSSDVRASFCNHERYWGIHVRNIIMGMNLRKVTLNEWK